MQGKSCFNFTSVDEPLLVELEELTRRGYDRTAGDPAWGAARRKEHGMAHRKAMPKGPQGPSGRGPVMADLAALETRLNAILDPYRDRLEAATIYNIPVLRRPGAKAHDWFASVQRVEVAVKFNFLPMHNHPDVLDGISRALRKRKTGASVFKLAELDDTLLAELESVVARGFERYMGNAGEALSARVRSMVRPNGSDGSPM